MNNTMENDLKQQNSFFRFEDLRVYHKAVDYAVWVQAHKNFFSEDGKILHEKLEQQAYEVALQIADGSSQNKNNFIHSLKTAKSAVRNCVVLSDTAKRAGLFNEEQFNESYEVLMELTKMLGALITSLQRGGGKNDKTKNQEDLSLDGDIDFQY